MTGPFSPLLTTSWTTPSRGMTCTETSSTF